MALATLARWIGVGTGDTHTSAATEQCGECGRFFDTARLKRARCNKCDILIKVCEDHRLEPKCLRCGYSVRCAMCGRRVKERCTNAVACTKCEEEIDVCDRDVARPVCSGCLTG